MRTRRSEEKMGKKKQGKKYGYSRYLCLALVLCVFLGGMCSCAGKGQEPQMQAENQERAENQGQAENQEQAEAERTLKTQENAEVKVTFFNVGKGDAVLVETAAHRMLVDAGYDDTAGVILDYLEKQAVKRLDLLVLTHFDKDHVGGADRVLEAVEVGEVLQPDYESDSKQYLEYEEMMGKKKMQPVLVTETVRMSLDGAEILIYPPQRKSYKEEDNDFSLVISMVYGKKSFLFAGDCEKERLKELLSQGEFDLAHDVLKVPHHGRKEKNSEEFFSAVSPEIAVITCSEEKPAEKEVVAMLEKLEAEVYFTTDGTAVCLCDGEKTEMRQ